MNVVGSSIQQSFMDQLKFLPDKLINQVQRHQDVSLRGCITKYEDASLNKRCIAE